MRIEELLKLIDKEEKRRKLNDPKKEFSRETIKKISRKFLHFRGIALEDIEKIIVPQIVDWEFSGDFSKEKLDSFYEQHSKIIQLPKPIRQTIDECRKQRRMDSLSRLLSLDHKYTPCVALAFYKGDLIVSSNAFNLKKDKEESELVDCLARKMGLIQGFLVQLTQNITRGNQPNIREIQFDNPAIQLADKTILNIISGENGGVGHVMPKNIESRHKHRMERMLHLRNALLKLGQYCLLSIYTNGEKGFNLSELNALLKNDTITVITPDPAELQGQHLHAEQAILHYLREYTKFNQESSEEKINIGISKLCCQACHDILSRQSSKISYRGSHGMNYFNVYDIDKNTAYEGEETRFSVDPHPSDSESECGFLSDNEHDFEDEIPTVEELITGESQPTVMNATANSRFFKACAIEANASSASPEHRILDMKI